MIIIIIFKAEVLYYILLYYIKRGVLGKLPKYLKVGSLNSVAFGHKKMTPHPKGGKAESPPKNETQLFTPLNEKSVRPLK
jgi:hypothetical protein